MHKLYTWIFDDWIEREYCGTGGGGKGKKRKKKNKATPEQIKKQNKRNKINKIRRLIKENFKAGVDYWVTLTYKKELRCKNYKKEEEKLLRNLRNFFKRIGMELKYIKKTERGKQGAVHHHLVINRIQGEIGTDQLLQKYWKNGGIHLELLYEDGGFQNLAEYIAKDAEEEGEEKKSKKDGTTSSYSTSRNLKQPEPKIERCTKKKIKEYIKNEPVPTEGFYIDKNSIESGENPVTGQPYLRYIEVRIKPQGHRRI